MANVYICSTATITAGVLVITKL